MRICRMSLMALLSPLLCGYAAETVSSGLMKGGMGPAALTADVTGAKDLTLIATVGPDTYDYDQAVWGNPRLVLSDGKTVDLTTLKPMEASVGWGTLLVNKSHSGALQIAGKKMEAGFWAHAPSELTFTLPANAVRFEAMIGLTAPSGKGSVVFQVESGDQAQRRKAGRLMARVNLDALERLIEWRLIRTPEQKEALNAARSQVRSGRALLKGEGGVEALKTAEALEALTRTLMLETNPAIPCDEVLFIRRKAGNFLPQNWQSNSSIPKNGHENTLLSLIHI